MDLQSNTSDMVLDNTDITQDTDVSTSQLKQDSSDMVTEPGTSNDLTASCSNSQPGTSFDNTVVPITSSVIEQTVASVQLSMANSTSLEQSCSSAEKPGSSAETENVTEMASKEEEIHSETFCNGITEENGHEESENNMTNDLNKFKDDSRTIDDKLGVDTGNVPESQAINNNKGDKVLSGDGNVAKATSDSRMEVDNEQTEVINKDNKTEKESVQSEAMVKSSVSKSSEYLSGRYCFLYNKKVNVCTFNKLCNNLSLGKNTALLFRINFQLYLTNIVLVQTQYPHLRSQISLLGTWKSSHVIYIPPVS